MNIMKKSSNGYQVIPLDSALLSQRKIFLNDTEGIDMASANRVVQQLMLLQEEDDMAPINLYISSPGGEITAGLLIYDQLKGMKAPVNLYCAGMAASMAAIILAGGPKGRRFILPHSKVMIHEPLIRGGVGGSATSIQRTAESIMMTKQITVELLAADTGRSVEEIDKAISYDHYMSAEEAIEFGICDKIVESL